MKQKTKFSGMNEIGIKPFFIQIKACSLFIILLFLSLSNTQAQNVVWGEESENYKSNKIFWSNAHYLIEHDNNYLLFHWKSVSSYLIEVYDQNMVLKKTTSPTKLSHFNGMKREYSGDSEFIIRQGDDLYLLTRTDRDSKDKVYWVVEKFNFESLTFEQPKSFFEYSMKKKDMAYYHIDYGLSPDKQKFYTYFQKKRKGEDNYSFYIGVYGPSFDLEWEKKDFAPENTFNMKKAMLTNDGMFYLYGSHFKKEGKTEINKKGVYAFYDKGSSTKFLKIEKSKEQEVPGLEDVEMSVVGDEFILSAFFRCKMYWHKGHYLLKADKKLEEVKLQKYSNYNLNDVKIALKGAFDDPKLDKHKKRGKTRYSYDTGNKEATVSIFNDDGSIYRVIQYYSYDWDYEHGSTTKMKNIYITRISAEGDIEWLRYIPLYSQSFVPITAIVGNDKLYVCYTDELGNIDMKAGGRLRYSSERTMRKSGFLVSEITKNGNADRRIVTNYKERKLGRGIKVLFPRDNSLVMMGINQNYRKKKVGKIILY